MGSISVKDITNQSTQTVDEAQQKANQVLANNKSMGKDQFLNLLVAQLQNQDPLQPMDNTQFISEMAQFSSLEQMNQMTSGLSQLRAVSMVGSYVEGTYTDPATGDKKDISGTVDSTKYNAGKITLTVNGQDVDPADVTVTSKAEPYQMQQMSSGLSQLKAVSMLGTYVEGTYIDSATKSTKNISGIVSSVKYNNGNVTLTVGGKDIDSQDVTFVSFAANAPNAGSNQQTSQTQ